jgi:hypothetical protein
MSIEYIIKDAYGKRELLNPRCAEGSILSGEVPPSASARFGKCLLVQCGPCKTWQTRAWYEIDVDEFDGLYYYFLQNHGPY